MFKISDSAYVPETIENLIRIWIKLKVELTFEDSEFGAIAAQNSDVVSEFCDKIVAELGTKVEAACEPLAHAASAQEVLKDFFGEC